MKAEQVNVNLRNVEERGRAGNHTLSSSGHEVTRLGRQAEHRISHKEQSQMPGVPMSPMVPGEATVSDTSGCREGNADDCQEETGGRQVGSKEAVWG